MHKIHLVTDCPFEKRDYERFGIESLLSQGFEYHVWDLSALIAPQRLRAAQDNGKIHHFSSYHSLSSKSEALGILCSFQVSDAVISTVALKPNSLRYLQALAKSQAKLVQLRLGNLPKSHVIRTAGSSPRKLRSRLHSLITKAKHLLRIREQLLLRLPFSALGLRAPDIYLAAGKVALDGGIPNASSSSIINTISLDYETFLETSKNKDDLRSFNDCIVYIDEYTPFHPDWAHVGIAPSCTAEELYPRLQNFFNEIEARTGKKVVIAAHPRSDYPKDNTYFGGRPLIKGQTASVISQCNFVMIHGSTSVSYAVLFGKPLLFMTSQVFSPYEKFSIDSMAESLGKKAIFFDEPVDRIDLSRELKVDQKAYTRYKELYLKAPDASEEKIWDAFGRHLK